MDKEIPFDELHVRLEWQRLQVKVKGQWYCSEEWEGLELLVCCPTACRTDASKKTWGRQTESPRVNRREAAQENYTRSDSSHGLHTARWCNGIAETEAQSEEQDATVG